MTSKWCGKCGGEIVERICSTCGYKYLDPKVTYWNKVSSYSGDYYYEVPTHKLESEGGYEPFWL